MNKQIQKEIQQEYLSEFANNVHRVHDRQHFINNQRSFNARGIRSLQQPSVYILSILFAFALYQIDRLYDLRNVYHKQRDNMNELSEELKHLPEKTREYAYSEWALLISIVILAGVIAAKSVYQRH